MTLLDQLPPALREHVLSIEPDGAPALCGYAIKLVGWGDQVLHVHDAAYPSPELLKMLACVVDPIDWRTLLPVTLREEHRMADVAPALMNVEWTWTLW